MAGARRAESPTSRLGRAEVEKVAGLARLQLTEGELETFAAQLSAVFEHVARLESVDTAAVSPASEAFDARAPMRQDVVQPPLAHDEALAGAPAVADGSFVVPRILATGRGGPVG